MRVLLVGASGYVGQSLTHLLLAQGCVVSALARSDEAAATMRRQGIVPIRGQVADVAPATRDLAGHDACIWLSWLPWDEEQAAVGALLHALEASGKTFVFTSGTGVLATPAREGEWCEDSFAESDPVVTPPHLSLRAETEAMVRAHAAKGIRAMVIRPPMIWGNGGSRQIPLMFDSVAKTGAAGYIGAGLNVYSHIHVEDLARVYWLALERGVAGALYHAVGGEVDFRTIAEAIAQTMACLPRSIRYDKAEAVFGAQMARGALAVNSRTRCPRTRAELGWVPRRPDLIEDIRNGSYRARFAEPAQSAAAIG